MVQIGSTPPYQPGDWSPQPPAQGMNRTERAQASQDIAEAMALHPDKARELHLLMDKVNNRLPDPSGSGNERFTYRKSYDDFKIELNELLNRP